MSPFSLLPLLLLLLLCTFSVHLSRAEYKSYHHDVVFRTFPKTQTHLEFLSKLQQEYEKYDFWTSLSLKRPVDVRVTKAHVQEAKSLFETNDLKFEIMIENVQTLVDQERQTLRSNKLDESYFDNYHTYDENIEWMNDLVQQYPTMTELVHVGSSYEGRDLLAVRVFAPNTSNSNKPIIWIDGGIHCREWISTATVLYILSHFVSDYENDTDIHGILSRADLYVLPMFNPDGYVYTWTQDRMWRKTRSPNAGSSCVGTDANRNFAYEWAGEGASGDPCSTSYYGASPFSEIETKSVSTFLSNLHNIVGYINFHSYSQLWMYAWGYTYDLPADDSELNNVSRKSVEALEAVYGTPYEYGSVANTIYICSGIAVDWCYGVLKITNSMTVELRDTGTYGFLLPPDQIIPSGIETLAGFKAYCNAIL